MIVLNILVVLFLNMNTEAPVRNFWNDKIVAEDSLIKGTIGVMHSSRNYKNQKVRIILKTPRLELSLWNTLWPSKINKSIERCY